MGEDYLKSSGSAQGEMVYAAANGVVYKVFTGSPNEWGGVVIIKHVAPTGNSFIVPGLTVPDSGEVSTNTVYTLYGHLNLAEIYVQENNNIDRGDPIGKIGLVPAFPTPHLHFEVKNQAAIDAEWQSGVGHGYSGTGNYAPNRYKPSSFIDANNHCCWNFNTPTNSEGWFAHNVQSTSVAPDGRYRIDPNTAYPLIQHDGLSLDANNYNAVEINMASNAPSPDAKLYFTTTTSPGYSDDKRVEFIVRHDGNWYTYTVYMKNNPEWKGMITGIKIDPAAFGKPGVDPSDTIGFDWIKFIKTEMKPAIGSVAPDYLIYNQGDLVRFNFWITNPFANNMPNTEIYAAIRRSNSGDSWITTNTLIFEGVTLRSATTTYGEAELYTKAISLPASASTGSYDAYAWVANQHPGFLLPYQSSDYIYDFRDLPYAFTVNVLNPVIIDPTPTPTPEPTYNPPPPVTPTPTPEIFDIDENFQINMDDVTIVVAHFNETTQLPYPRYDVNQDGVVDVLDVATVSIHVI